MTSPSGPVQFGLNCYVDATGLPKAVNPANGLPVTVVGTLTVNNTPTASATGALSRLRRISTADTNLHTIKGAPGRLFSVTVANDAASKRYLKIYNRGTNPTLATDVPQITIVCPPGASIQLDWDAIGIYFSTGIAAAITGAMIDTDVTAIAANDVSVTYDFL